MWGSAHTMVKFCVIENALNEMYGIVAHYYMARETI